ncbi:tetratricopeptide repeat protein [Microbulbifer sp. Q7]|uniref:tetratricopeptide repeat protein n=1 Tax=Microbulbifer sp. Q7 TaxID=1785091 RepID=UPI00082E51E0|nr:tetratricopeptide repeat protein [Microbulbifer sp. Q7]
MSRHFLLLWALVFSASCISKDKSILEENLVGKWAMFPVAWPVAGAANITEYRDDGSYKLKVFICDGKGGFERKPELDSEGRWEVHKQKIITTVLGYESNQGGAKSLSEIRQELKSKEEFGKKFYIDNAPRIVVDALGQSEKMTIVEESIVSLAGNEMRGGQEWENNQFVEMSYVKVKKIEPLCQHFAANSHSLEGVRLLAARGEAGAQFKYGKMFFDGSGVERDYLEAHRWVLASAISGNAEAQNFLGAMRKFSWGKVEKDYADSIKWLQKSYDQGNMNAAFNLALSYRLGRGLEKDLEKSSDLFLQAAWSGLLAAQGQVAANYFYGRGVPSDYVKAYAWYKVSGEGHDYVAKFMSDEEVKEAELMVNGIVQKLFQKNSREN